MITNKEKELLKIINGVGFRLKRVKGFTPKLAFVECAHVSTEKAIDFDVLLGSRRFSHIDVMKTEHSLSATIVDEKLGTIFGVSSTRKELTLVPKHRTKLLSFVHYYQMIVKKLDKKAKLMKFSAYSKMKHGN